MTEKEYFEEIERVEMVKRLKEINENAEQAGDLLGFNEEDSPIVTAIKQRQCTYNFYQSLKAMCLQVQRQ